MKKNPARSSLALAASFIVASTCTAVNAGAEEPLTDRPSAEPAAPAAGAKEKSWEARYDEAYTLLREGKLREASSKFHALAHTARTESERFHAHEMARLASESADEAEQQAAAAEKAARARPIRGSDELTLLYASAFLYGAGSGVWFLLATQPDSAVTATLPFAALTAAPVIALATIDSLHPLPRGVPHSISSGLYIGLGESVWIIGRQQARAARVRNEDPANDLRFRPETVTAVLWTGATLGGVLGGALGSGLQTTAGRVSFTASATLWSGVLTGLGAGALLPDDERRSERAFLVGGAGYNAGLLGGLLFAGDVSPSVSRVRLADLFAVAGGLVTTGAYLTLSRDVDTRAAEGIAAGGIIAGLATGWFVTRGMSPDLGTAPPKSTINPTFVPVPAGAGVGVGGAF